MGKRWSKNTINEARSLRTKGWSYSMICERFGVAKSTLHYWIGDMPIPRKISDKRRRHLRRIQPLGAEANRQKRIERVANIKEEVKVYLNKVDFSGFSKKAMLSFLYWAEGTKSGESGMVMFSNTDPKLMLVFITLLRECYSVDEENFRARIYVHYYHNVREVKKYWSELLGIPLNRFYKTHRKARSKNKRFRRNMGGICHLYYNRVALRDKIMFFYQELADRLVGEVPVV